MNQNKAFTIVELLVVIVIIGILSAIAFVSYGGITDRANLASAKSSANSYLQAVKNKYILGQNSSSMTDGMYYVNKNSDADGTKLTNISVSGSLPTGTDDYVVLRGDNITEYQLTYNGYVLSFIDDTYSAYKTSALYTLDTPTFTLSDLDITVTSSKSHISSYALYANGVSQGSFPSTAASVDITSLSGYNLTKGQTYNLTLKAISSDPEYRDSAVSDTASFTAFTFVKTYLYQEGDLHTSTTGGWSNTMGMRTGIWDNYPSTFNSDHILLSENYGLWAQSPAETIGNLINYTNYNQIAIDYELTGPIEYSLTFQISNSSSFDYTSEYSITGWLNKPAGRYLYTRNLSDVYNGNAYLKITLISSSTVSYANYDKVKIYNVYLLSKSYN